MNTSSARRSSGARRALGALLGTLVAIGATVPVAPSASGAISEVIPEEGFGGYRYWPTVVRSVSAIWRVPAISAKSPDGNASTWIGAQNEKGGYPFIHVGTTENDILGSRFYFAFWSDTAVDFHPQPMHPVAPGDRVEVSMTRREAAWHLVLDDLTSGRVTTTNVTYGGVAPFTQAEWLQEDPTSSNITEVDLSYPKMTDVRFTEVRLNGGAPHLALANGQTLMATGGVFRVPTPFAADAFGLVPPTGYGRQYLADVYPIDMAIDAYDVQLFGWGGLDRGQREANTRTLIRAYQVFERALGRQPWPPPQLPD